VPFLLRTLGRLVKVTQSSLEALHPVSPGTRAGFIRSPLVDGKLLEIGLEFVELRLNPTVQLGGF